MDGAPDAEVPIEWWVSRLCEEFHCLPSQAVREWHDAPAGFLEGILEARAFVHAKRMWETAAKPDELPMTPMLQLVKDLEFDSAETDLHGEPADH